MKIKDIKEKYKTYGLEHGGGNRFRTSEYNGEKIVAIMRVEDRDWKNVTQVVRVSDGAPLLGEDRCRCCYGLDDAEDVAWEMLQEEHLDWKEA